MTTRHNRSGRRVRASARAALCLAPLACAGALVVAGGPSFASGTPTAVYGSDATCAVDIQVGSTSATAVLLSGCQGSDYWLSSWVTHSGTYQPGASQQLLDATDRAPWTVRLPTGQPCYYQVDFSERQTPPGHSGGARTLIASTTGQTSACSSATTTVTSTTGGSSTTITSPRTVAAVATTTVPLLPATTLALTTPTRPPAIASSSATGTTTTTTVASRLAVGQIPSGQTPAPTAVPVAASSASHGFGSLAFTGFAVLMAAFVALVLIVTGAGLVRVSRGARGLPVDSPASDPGGEG